jgi:acetyltransferase-like isoleucine patch superfamily enzyme
MMNPLVRPPIGPHSLDTLRAVEPPANPRDKSRISSVLDELSHFVNGVDVRRLGWNAARLLPPFTLARSRARLLSAVGCDIGPGTAVTGYVYLVGPRDCARALRVGSGCILGPDVTFCLDAPITLGRNVSIGPRAVLYTATHPLGVASRRMQLDVLARPITVEEGAWIGLGAMILPGVRVGRGAVVAAGAVVSADVPDNVLIAGNPAAVVQELPTR